MNSSFDDNILETNTEPEISVEAIEQVKIEESDATDDETYFHYEFLEDDTVNPIANNNNSDEIVQNISVEYNEILCSDNVNKNENSSNYEPDSWESDDSEKSAPPQKKKKRLVNDSDCPAKSPLSSEEYIPKRKRRYVDDPDYSDPESIVDKYKQVTLNNFKRTINKSGCIFKDCDKKETNVIPDVIRRRLLQEYKLYILQHSKACFEHMRDQNWEELFQCTYNKFSATDIEDILKLQKQESQAALDFQNIEHIPTRLIRYWMNVNKVQFERIYKRFPLLQTLISPKAALSMYLMYLQNKDVKRMALLLQIPEPAIMYKIQSVQAIVPCSSYEELSQIFNLEY